MLDRIALAMVPVMLLGAGGWWWWDRQGSSTPAANPAAVSSMAASPADSPVPTPAADGPTASAVAASPSAATAPPGTSSAGAAPPGTAQVPRAIEAPGSGTVQSVRAHLLAQGFSCQEEGQPGMGSWLCTNYEHAPAMMAYVAGWIRSHDRNAGASGFQDGHFLDWVPANASGDEAFTALYVRPSCWTEQVDFC